MLTRLGLRDTRRLGKRMGQISDNELIKIRGIVKSML